MVEFVFLVMLSGIMSVLLHSPALAIRGLVDINFPFFDRKSMCVWGGIECISVETQYLVMWSFKDSYVVLTLFCKSEITLSLKY